MCRSAASAGQGYFLARLRHDDPGPVSAQAAGGGEASALPSMAIAWEPMRQTSNRSMRVGTDFAGPAQGIGGDDDVKPRAGRLSALPIQKITDHLAFDFAAA